MVAPSYTTDLNLISTMEGASTGDEFVNMTQGGSPVLDADYFIQGAACHTANQKNKTGLQSIAFDYGATISFATGECIFMWQVLLAGNAIELEANGGYRLIAGTDLTNWDSWYVGGSDGFRNPYGGWQNSVAWPSFTPDATNGGAGAYQWFGSGVNMTSGIQKGNLHGLDYTAYGRGQLIVSGGNLEDGYCTFAGMATQNDLTANRWGLFQEQAGGYLWKGLISIGIAQQEPNVNPSASFVDSNRVITVDKTNRTYKDFNKIEIGNTGSYVSWDNILISSVDATGLSIGDFEVVDDAAGKGNGLLGVNLETCVFTDMNTFIFKPNCFVNNSTFRRCGLVTQSSATFDSCTFDEPSGANGLLVNNIENIDTCDFVSKGTGHAMELTSAHIQDGSYTIENCSYTGFATVSGGTRNEVIYNNSGNDITLLIDGGDVPSIRNGTNASTDIIVATTYTLTGVVSGSEVQIVTQDALDDGTVSAEEDLFHNENTTVDDGSGRGTTQTTYAYNYVSDIPIYVYLHKLGYEWTRVIDTLTNTNKSVPVSQKTDRNYLNP